MFTLNPDIIKSFQPSLTDFLASMFKQLKSRIWISIKELIYHFSNDSSELYGLRFGVLLIEFFREWAVMTESKTNQSYFQLKWSEIKTFIPMHKGEFYLYKESNLLFYADYDFMSQYIPEMLHILPPREEFDLSLSSFSKSFLNQSGNFSKSLLTDSIRINENTQVSTTKQKSENFEKSQVLQINNEKVKSIKKITENQQNETKITNLKNETEKITQQLQENNSKIVQKSFIFNQNEASQKINVSFYVQSKLKNRIIKQLSKNKKKQVYLNVAKSLSSSEIKDLNIVESLFIERKILMHEIFKPIVVLESISFLKEDIEMSLVNHFEEIKNFIVLKKDHLKDYQSRLIFETKFFKQFFILFEKRKINNSLSSDNFKDFKNELVDLIQSLFGCVPALYQQAKNDVVKIYRLYDKFESDYSGNNSMISNDFDQTFSIIKSNVEEKNGKSFSFSMDGSDFEDQKNNSFTKESGIPAFIPDSEMNSICSSDEKVEIDNKLSSKKTTMNSLKPKTMKSDVKLNFKSVCSENPFDQGILQQKFNTKMERELNVSEVKHFQTSQNNMQISFPGNPFDKDEMKDPNSLIMSLRSDKNEIQQAFNLSFFSNSDKNQNYKKEKFKLENSDREKNEFIKTERKQENNGLENLNEDEYYLYLKQNYDFVPNLKVSKYNKTQNNPLFVKNNLTDSIGVYRGKDSLFKENLAPKKSEIEMKYMAMKEKFLSDYIRDSVKN